MADADPVILPHIATARKRLPGPGNSGSAPLAYAGRPSAPRIVPKAHAPSAPYRRTPAPFRVELDQDVDVAVEPKLRTEYRSEQRQFPDLVTLAERRDRLAGHRNRQCHYMSIIHKKPPSGHGKAPPGFHRMVPPPFAYDLKPRTVTGTSPMRAALEPART